LSESVFKMLARPWSPDPASKVSATIFRFVGSEYHSTPRSEAGSTLVGAGVGVVVGVEV
jgi:hypothetical protein